MMMAVMVTAISHPRMNLLLGSNSLCMIYVKKSLMDLIFL